VPMVMHNRQWSHHSDYIKNLYDVCHDLPSLLPPPLSPMSTTDIHQSK